MTHRILVTGAGGPSAVSLIKALRGAGYDVLAADMSPYASGLFLVPDGHRKLLPRGDAPDFAHRLLSVCAAAAVDVLIPTVDSELVPVARACESFALVGTRLVLAPERALATCLDKAALAVALEGVVPLPRTVIVRAPDSADVLGADWIAKPRAGSGSRGILRITGGVGRDAVPTDGSYIAQEYLPGAEYSVDVLCDGFGRFLGAVPRERLRVDSGVAVAARTVDDADLVRIARRAVEALGLSFVSNVQLRRDADGVPRLLEINPRFPGTMPLTVAAGIDMPRLAVDAALGRPMPLAPLRYKVVGMVRTFEEHFVPAHAFERVAAGSTRPIGLSPELELAV